MVMECILIVTCGYLILERWKKQDLYLKIYINHKVYFSKNGTYQNSQDPTNGTNAITLTVTSDGYHIGFTYDTGGTVECNFGGYHVNTLSSSANDGQYGDFEYAPPSGYYALCTKRLGEYG